MEEKISVIVPIYKVENYLAKCVDSIINQTYKNLEIILVDDGSPDKCPQMCDEYAKNDSRIKVIHKENGGLSDARNAGMKIATGKYISFIDSDDWVSADFFKVLYDTMIDSESDIVECDVLKVDEEKPDLSVNDFKEVKVFDKQTGLSMLISEKEFHQHVWNKLYKAEVALSVPFERGKLNEDEFWTYQIFGQAKKVAKVSKSLYFYLQRTGSIMAESYSLRRLDALEAKAQRQKYIEKYFPQLKAQAKIDMFSSCVFACQASMKFMKKQDKVKAKKIIKEYAKNYKLSKEELKTLTGKIYLWLSFANMFFVLCCKIRSIIGVGF